MTQSNNNSLSDNDQLEILADAISDVGYWSWWTEELPGIFQIEFGGTQLYFPPIDADWPPQTRIAIQFQQPSSINFISRNTETDNFEWSQLLHEDKMEPPTCSHGEFVFGNSDDARQLLAQIKSYKTVFGFEPTNDNFFNEPVTLVFWCGNIGFTIAARELKLLNHSGHVALTDIADINKKWWDYWRTYWDKRDTADALPKDYACEVTIPLK